ncbi:Purine 5'-nucleotidase [Parasponia andersonii]|uniref:Purine 5'-nucleotidase n=1 Tax=Parasponia andersonii TaxID=3476 RepID=A0A2P5BI38_PARAD|nr:Purine 5'-nucleotidase [Parasponia andersonii]
MASSFRRFLPLAPSISRTSRSISFPGLAQGLGGSYRSYGGTASWEELVSKFEGRGNSAEVDSLVLEDEVEKIRREFDSAKKSFLNIPEALKTMPKMNPEGIYVNKNLRLDNIQVYGFDYDYTLAHYSKNLQSLIYDLAKEHMVNEFRYPEICMEFKYDPNFPIRGLYYDKLKGCLLKLDFFGSIEPDGCYFGRRKLSRKEIEEIYGTRHIGRDQARGLVGLMDFFCFSEACLIADIVQHFVNAKLEFDPSYIYQDVNRAIQYVHRSGSVHRGILSDPHRYLVKNGQLLHFLKMLRKKGKKLFLLTNSPYYFVDGGMRFLLEDSMSDRDSWRELFDVVIAKANKPDFYTSEHPFRCYDSEKDTLAFTKVDRFLPDKIYYHGCLKSFLQITKWNGPEVIYFGDHLFSDLRGPSKAGWRTAAIIHELESEIRTQNEDAYRFEQAKFHIIQELLGKLHSTVASNHQSKGYKLLLEELNLQRLKARHMMKGMFNMSFGATFLTDTGQESAFAYHIHQYADVYTSKPENFLLYPSDAWLHVPFDIKIIPHHLKVSSSLFKS